MHKAAKSVTKWCFQLRSETKSMVSTTRDDLAQEPRIASILGAGSTEKGESRPARGSGLDQITDNLRRPGDDIHVKVSDRPIRSGRNLGE